jgi:anti-sigma regulatory factor (Ser/Thr protein kinase)/serine/threonine protein phosphatase PrpC
MEPITLNIIEVSHVSDINTAKRKAKTFASAIGFNNIIMEKIGLTVSELSSNLIKHAGGGKIIISKIEKDRQLGIKIESVDDGPGIMDLKQALINGFSSSGTLGYGLGTVIRLMDEVDFKAESQIGGGSHIICKKWLRKHSWSDKLCPLDISVASRPHKSCRMNGDAFIIKKWEKYVLVGIIDGIGHGEHAHKAAQTARRYVETHYDQTLLNVFQGINRICQPTRGVVMALARINWLDEEISYASVGNIESRVFGGSHQLNFIARRGILGVSNPKPQIIEGRWNQNHILVLFSDGLRSHWNWESFSHLLDRPAAPFARELLNQLAKDNDDATVLVIKEAMGNFE